MIPTESAPEPPATDAPPERILSPRAQLARRRALLAIGGITALLLLLWFGDALSGLVPHGAYHPTTQQAGAYHATLAVAPSQPKAGTPLHTSLRVTDAANRPVAAIITYTWEMVTMDMGTTRGTAAATAISGTYAVNVTAFMGGYWRLTAHIHTANLPDANVAFDIPVQG